MREVIETMREIKTLWTFGYIDPETWRIKRVSFILACKAAATIWLSYHGDLETVGPYLIEYKGDIGRIIDDEAA